jgi:protein involved in polysaccharide export with SLBB domain
MLGIRNVVRKAGAVLVACLVNVPLGAQEQAPRTPAQNAPVYRQPRLSELEKENLERVAASAPQIIGILQRDPGLLVELKRWVAKEAADNGQLLEDADLADRAVFDRLGGDVRFRSVATRLLQRYGYLAPSLNPNSESAKEQDLILKERARRLVQIEAQEDSASLEKNRAERITSEIEGCAGREESDCSAPRVGGRARRTQVPMEGAEQPLRTPAIPRQTAPQRGERSIETMASAPAPDGFGGQQPGFTPAGDVLRQVTEVESGLLPAGELEGASRAGVAAPRSFVYGENVVPGSAVETKNDFVPRGEPARAKSRGSEEELASVPLVRRPNPYPDIPSLYDMYVQAAERGRPLERFGMGLFRNGTKALEAMPMDLPVGPDYVVGPGDGLAIDLWGAVSQRLFRTVDREGRISLPEAGPLLVSGRSLGEVQEALQQALRTQFRDISADVSLSRLRTVRVYVVGEVAEPGAHDISSLSTPLNALFEAGGVTLRGSLRQLKHYRGKQLIEEVDAYDLLLHGVRGDLKRLENGDTLLVPPLGPQVRVDGMVRRPAVYELRGEKSLAEVLELAGGILPAAALRHIEVQRLEEHQKRTMLSLNLSPTDRGEETARQLSAFEIRGGDEIHIFPIAPYNEDAIHLEGHVLRPGRYSYRPGMRLTDLIASYSDLLPEPAPHYAEIVRLNRPDFHPSVESFDLAAALANPEAAPKLEPLDTVRIFSRYDFEPVPAVSVSGEVRLPGTYRTSGQAHVRDAIFLSGGTTPDAELESAQLFRREPDGTSKIVSINLREALAGNPVDNILLRPRDHLFVHRVAAKVDPATVYIKGEVAKPGRYPLTSGLRVADLIRLAGGLKRSADTGAADLTRFSAKGQKQAQGEHVEVSLAVALAGDPLGDLVLRDGDVLTIRQIPGWNDIGAAVAISGEVSHPGTYGIKPGERLSSVLRRAGGFLPTAYPQGIVFERVSVRELQEKSRQELIQRIEQEAGSVKASLQQSSQEQATLQQVALEQRRRQIEALQKAPVTGRMVVRLRSDLAEFEKSPDNVELRNGDSITIPKRPSFVLVTGQVYNSNAITYKPGRNAEWYLRQAGGTTDQANKKATFIVRANGSVISGKGDWWSGSALSAQIEPGDMIVVPEKAIGGSAAWKNLLSIAQLAESASLAAFVVTR